MPTSATVLAVMLSLSQAWEDRAETAEKRTELLKPWAEAISDEARTTGEAAGLVAIAHGESGGFARWILEGRCHERPKMCDRGRARGPFQLHDWCKATDVRGETACAASAYRYAVYRCGGTATALGHYASGNRCYQMPARERLRIAIERRLTTR